MSIGRQIFVSLLATLIFGGCSRTTGLDTLHAHDAMSAISALRDVFPDAVEITRSQEMTVAFCPDNTCDLIVAQADVPYVDLDFTFLFIFYFSDYYDLQRLRNDDRAAQTATAILGSPRYRSCRRGSRAADARCVLQSLAGVRRISAYAVRHDENVESRVQYDLGIVRAQFPSM